MEEGYRPMKKKVVIIAGEPSHGPGSHEYEKTARLFKVLMDNSNVAAQIHTEYHLNGWPEDERTFHDADLVIFMTDGRDGDKFKDVPFVLGDRMKLMEGLMNRGCGLMLLHFSTFFTQEEGRYVLDWAGGYFECEDENGENIWYSKISVGESLELMSPQHPISSGVSQTIPIHDEVYWKLRFPPADSRMIPIWKVPHLEDADTETAGIVGWALERKDGGRAFCTSAGHAFKLWEDDDFRRLHLNAVVWAAGLKVPLGGVQSRHYTDDQVNEALRSANIPAEEEQTRVLVISGNEAHKWHHWEETAPKIKRALESDSGIAVDLSFSIDDLAEPHLPDYDVIVLNYCNWQDSMGLSDLSKRNLLSFLDNYGGLVVLHFSNGSFHFSLPEAGESDWPEFRNIVPRVWNHHGSSGHDPLGTFTVKVVDYSHPITSGLTEFQVTDELYYRQEGSKPVNVLYSAISSDTGEEEPLAWTTEYKGARVYQTLLGHCGETYAAAEVNETLRRGVLWAAGRL
ncbi:MAG TPA: ThuA domain-containing protein [Bacilli bacterium]